MKKNIIKQLETIATKQLPVQKEVRKVSIRKLGSEFPEGGKDSNGKPYDPEKTYIVQEPKEFEVNQVERLKNIYKKGGSEAVTLYVAEVNKREAKKRREGQPQPDPIPKEMVVI